jgi:uncharacterized protein with NRDE domain
VAPYDERLVCLLVALSHVDAATPLVIAANRDEYHARAATAMTTLGAPGRGGTILGGLDHVSGGTWLAVNAAGVVAGLTNRPLPEGPDRAKRSRGELPLHLVGHATAREAVEAFVERIRPGDYNPAWLLVGDRTHLFYVDVTGDDHATAEELPAGVHVLENRPLHEPSPKADRVRHLLGASADGAPGPSARVDDLATMLGDHERPCAGAPPSDDERPLEVEARTICVHDPADGYGTRSSNIITVSGDPSREPSVRYTDGAPCAARWHSADERW